MIEDVFDLSRICSGHLMLNKQTMALNDVVARAVESTRPAALAKRVSLETATCTVRLLILGDSDRIEQAVVNILSNAIKFTDENGSVLVTLTSANTMARVIVEDTGQGVSSEFLPRIFDRYAQANKSSVRGKSGLGLGLPLVREIVERHGGRVTAKSAGVGLGATFTIDLPTVESIATVDSTNRRNIFDQHHER
jgi:signal transduction histidine kinase